MKIGLLEIVVTIIILSSIIFVIVWNIPEECDEECVFEPRRIETGKGAQGIFEPNKASSNFSLELTQKLKNARDILSENQDIIPWTGLGVSTSENAVTISIDDKNPEDYRKIIEELVGDDIPVIIKKGGDPFIDSDWITGEDYCSGWCDQEELVSIGCNESILAHLGKYSNLLDEEFDGTFHIDWMGLPDGVSVEKFDECVDFIYEKRTSVELENLLCIGGRGMIVNEDCERIGKYDVSTGLPIVENKEQCDMLDGDWNEQQNICDSKYSFLGKRK
jgi:hypothetical protein